jgi:hypothetical protein
MSEKKPRGNGLKKIYIDFSKVKDMKVSEIYGTEPLQASELAKRIWALIRTHNLKMEKKS